MTPQNADFTFMRLRNKILIMSLFVVLFTSCQAQDTAYGKLKNYLHTLSDTLDIDRYEAIFYVSENGCPTCNKTFSSAVQKHVFNKKNALIILNAKGHVFDIKPYREQGVSNVVVDFTSNFYRLHLSAASCIITLKEQAVDTIIELNVSQLGSQLDLIPKLVETADE